MKLSSKITLFFHYMASLIKRNCLSGRAVEIIIHYRFIGVIENPVKEENIVLEARQGVAVEILLIFLLLRLPFSATGGGRLRNLVPHPWFGTNSEDFSSVILIKNQRLPKGNLWFLVGVTGLEPMASWSRTKRDTKLRHTPIDLCYYILYSLKNQVL